MTSTLKSYWKDLWMKIKVSPWSLTSCCLHLRVLHNLLVDFLSNKLFPMHQDVNWVNMQFIFCIKEVENSVSSQKLISEVLIDVSCHDVISACVQCLKCMDASQHQEILVELIRSILSLGIIWVAEKTDMSDVRNLFTICHQKDILCLKVNPEVMFVSQKLCNHVQGNHNDFERNSNFQADFDVVKHCHPGVVYLFFFSMYERRQYSALIRTSLDYLKNHEDNFNQARSLLYNLIACSYVRLKKQHMAIVQWRKAVQCCSDTYYLLPLLYNLHKAYKLCEMPQPSVEMIKVAMSIVESNQTVDSCTGPCSVIFEWSVTDSPTLKVQPLQRRITNSLPLACYSARCSLNENMASQAVTWYKQALATSKERFDPASFSQSSEYQLPLITPTSMQISSEYALALYKTNAFSELMDFDCSDVEYISASYQKACMKIPDETTSSTSDKHLLIRCATQLYHCVTVLLYKAAASMSQGFYGFLPLISRSLTALADVQPIANECSSDENDHLSVQLHTVMCRLSRVKAMLYFNQAMAAATSTDLDTAGILNLLQSCLRYDSRDIDTRWNVTLLLWKIGQHEEGIKTWCKTRNINYKLNYQELKAIKDAKSAALDSCRSETKISYLEKDLCVLNELLRMVSIF